MELRLHHIIDHLYNIFLENDGSESCAQLLEEEVNKMFGTKYLNDEHDCNVVSMCRISGFGKTLEVRTLGCARRSLSPSMARSLKDLTA